MPHIAIILGYTSSWKLKRKLFTIHIKFEDFYWRSAMNLVKETDTGVIIKHINIEHIFTVIGCMGHLHLF